MNMTYRVLPTVARWTDFLPYNEYKEKMSAKNKKF
jgi:hypothetical protein